MPLRHILLALGVVAVWGTNFVVIHVGLTKFPPLLFAAMRFTFALLPAAFFLPRPTVTWSNLAAFGLLIGAGQFGLLFIAMDGLISPGLASLVIQMQVFFTVGLSAALAGERIRPFQVAALAIGAIGVGVIALHADHSTTPLGLGLVLLAAASWSGGNLAAKASGTTDMLAYVVWSSLFAAPPLYIMAFVIEGGPAIVGGLRHASSAAWAALAWQTVGNTLFGYTAWSWLLGRYPAATVTPMALLVPVFGMGASALELGEALPTWKVLAAALVLGGLVINLTVPRWQARRAARTAHLAPEA